MNIKKFSSRFFAVLALATSLLHCSNAPPPPDPGTGEVGEVMVGPGQTTRELGTLYYTNAGGNATDEGGSTRESSACIHLAQAGSVVLGRVVGKVNYIPRPKECAGPFSDDVYQFDFETWGVAWGEEVPARFTAVMLESVGRDDLVEDGVFFLTVRKVDYAWVPSTVTPVRLEPTDRLPTDTDLPDTFEGVVETLNDLAARLASACPRAAAAHNSDEEYRIYVFDARARGYDCSPQEPVSTDEPQYPCEVPEPPPCCFDDTLPGCDPPWAPGASP